MSGKFIKIKCKDCESIQIGFNKSTTSVKCNVCGATLLIPTGGKAILRGEVVEVLE